MENLHTIWQEEDQDKSLTMFAWGRGECVVGCIVSADVKEDVRLTHFPRPWPPSFPPPPLPLGYTGIFGFPFHSTTSTTASSASLTARTPSL